MEIRIGKEWRSELKDFLKSKHFLKLFENIKYQYSRETIFPELCTIFKAFEFTPFSKVKVVILGQNPYHNDNQAHGLSFSVAKGVSLPPSLKNIYKEIESDLGIKKDFSDGNLENWAKQGVFLLNSMLTVSAHAPSSHKDMGWEDFTDYVIQTISDKRTGIVFMLWGNFAKSKKCLIDTSKHLVLEASHPSPFSVRRGFFGCKHFSKCNVYLKNHNQVPISW